MSAPSPDLTFVSFDADNCRSYYRNAAGLLRCIQQDGRRHIFYDCTSEGEPCYEVIIEANEADFAAEYAFRQQLEERADG